MTRPRVASWYEHRLGRNDGNPLYVTNVLKRDYQDALQFVHLVPDPSSPLQVFGLFDLNLWIDWGEDALGGVLPYEPIKCPSPGAYWASDTHLGYDYRLQKAQEMQWVFCAQKRAVDEFRRDGLNTYLEWLPHAVEPTVYNPAAIYAKSPEELATATTVHRLKRWDVCFVGHLNTTERVDLLDTVFKAVPNSWWARRFFERAADIYTQSKVVLNHSVRDDVNMRVFETLATRSFLLTSEVPTLHELFIDGKHLVTFTDAKDCIEKIQYYAAHDEEREAIAEAGYKEVLAWHTFGHRVKRILQVTGVL